MPVSIGTTTISAMYLGTTTISAMYLGTTQVFGGATFSPASLFAASEPGGWYDPSDLTTLFQDRAGTVPVTAAGQLVGMRLDKSGRGNHLTAINDAARGTYNTDGTLHWIAYDGVNTGYVSPTITPGTDKAQVFAGVRKLSDVAGMVLELSSNFNNNAGTLNVVVSASYGYGTHATGSGTIGYSTNNSIAYSPPNSAVLSGGSDLSAATSAGQMKHFRLNGLSATNTSVYSATTAQVSFGNYPLYVGRRGGTTFPFNGRDYGLIIRFGTNLEAATIGQVETYLAAKSGVTL